MSGDQGGYRIPGFCLRGLGTCALGLGRRRRSAPPIAKRVVGPLIVPSGTACSSKKLTPSAGSSQHSQAVCQSLCARSLRPKCSWRRPGIDYIHADTAEVANIARRHRNTPRTSDRSDLTVGRCDIAAASTSACPNVCELARRRPVERQHTLPESLAQHSLDIRQERLPTSARR